MKDQPDSRTTWREQGEAARIRDLGALLRQRPDLIGVHPPADLTAEGLRWCV